MSTATGTVVTQQRGLSQPISPWRSASRPVDCRRPRWRWCWTSWRRTRAGCAPAPGYQVAPRPGEGPTEFYPTTEAQAVYYARLRRKRAEMAPHDEPEPRHHRRLQEKAAAVSAARAVGRPFVPGACA